MPHADQALGALWAKFQGSEARPPRPGVAAAPAAAPPAAVALPPAPADPLELSGGDLPALDGLIEWSRKLCPEDVTAHASLEDLLA